MEKPNPAKTQIYNFQISQNFVAAKQKGTTPQTPFPKNGHHFPFTLLALIIFISIGTCAKHGMHLQAEGQKRKKPTNEKGPNLLNNQARTENVRFDAPVATLGLILASSSHSEQAGV